MLKNEIYENYKEFALDFFKFEDRDIFQKLSMSSLVINYEIGELVRLSILSNTMGYNSDVVKCISQELGDIMRIAVYIHCKICNGSMADFLDTFNLRINKEDSKKESFDKVCPILVAESSKISRLSYKLNMKEAEFSEWEIENMKSFIITIVRSICYIANQVCDTDHIGIMSIDKNRYSNASDHATHENLEV